MSLHPAIHYIRAGQPAPKVSRFAEVIGPPDCPIMKRWTLVPWNERKHENHAARWKLMVHHFYPSADDRAVHDHPRPFWTFVLWGSYDDMAPCAVCGGEGMTTVFSDTSLALALPPDLLPCEACGGTGVVLYERMRPGKLRYRPATHRHRTKVGPRGCWTVVVMGSLQRRWGFWRYDLISRRLVWIPWRTFERMFGFGMRCGEDDE